MIRHTIVLLLVVFLCTTGISVWAKANPTHQIKPVESCDDTCENGKIYIAESIPLFLNLTTNVSTHTAWLNLINSATQTIDMGIFYMTLTEGGNYSTAYGGSMGTDVFKALLNAHLRGVKIRIAQNMPSPSMPDDDAQYLVDIGAAEVRSVNWPSLCDGAGILHTKVIIVDDTSAYVGSANLDWRSLAQVKELGVVVENCRNFVMDTSAAFEQYWEAAIIKKLPRYWDFKYSAKFNASRPAQLRLNNESFSMFLAVSPPQFVSKDRTGDINSLVAAINAANESICISVMDYAPTSFYYTPNFFWGTIDNALRAAAFNRGVQVRMLISHWNHTNAAIVPQFLHSLDQVANIDVRWFHVPDLPFSPQVPFTRVNHAKYMVTEQQSYVGTSNWTEDYFESTGGLSYNIFNANFTAQLQSIFDRDWNSPYALPITTW